MKYEILFESERIYFIKLTEELVYDYLNMINDKEVQKFISHNKRTYDYDGEIEWIKSKLENNALIFSMIEKETNEFIGNIEIMRIRDNTGEMGISITPKKQDKHFGQEAIKRIIEYAFNDLNLDKLELNVYDYNHRGINCYKKAGFVIEGQGETEEDIYMSIKR